MQTKSRNEKKRNKRKTKGHKKTKKNGKQQMKKKKHVKQNRLAYFIMGVGYLSEPGFGVLYFGGFFF